ncbi:hypothetical protein YPPY16_3368, partial [Yersinia pestis PY-16]
MQHTFSVAFNIAD